MRLEIVFLKAEEVKNVLLTITGYPALRGSLSFLHDR